MARTGRRACRDTALSGVCPRLLKNPNNLFLHNYLKKKNIKTWDNYEAPFEVGTAGVEYEAQLE